MNLYRWLSIILAMGLILAFNPLGAQAGPNFEHHPQYRHQRGNAHGWQGSRHHGFDRHHKYVRRSWKGSHYPHHYVRQVGPPPVVYVQPVTPVWGVQSCPQPQPYYSQPAAPGFSAQFNFGF
jgi:hypothetical protein